MAGTEVGSLYYDLNIDDKNLKSQLDNADKSVKGFGDRIGQYWDKSVDSSKMLLKGVAAAGAAVVAFGVVSVKAYNESEQSLAQLDSVLKSTGGSAGITRDQAISLSKEIQRTTSMSDEAALAVENMGLTFTAIGKDIFPQATKTAIDMATALNHGMKPSAEQAADAMKLMGKALQDPDAGLGALHRVGVNTDELAKKFVGLTDKSEKQKLILKELGTEFGGSAANQAQTFAGAIDQLKNAFNDIQEIIGGVIIKALDPLVGAISVWMYKVGGAEGAMKLLTDEFNRLKPYIPIIAGALLGALLPAIISITIALASSVAALTPWALLGAGVVLVAKKLHISFGDVKNAAIALKEKLDPFIPSFQQLRDFGHDTARAFEDLWHWTLQLPPAFELVANPIGFIMQNFAALKQAAKDVADIFMIWIWPALVDLGRTIRDDLGPSLQQLWDSLVRLWNAMNPALTDALKLLAIYIGINLVASIRFTIDVLNFLAATLSWVANAISDVIGWISNIIGWFGNFYGAVWNAVVGINNIIKGLIQAFFDLNSTIINNLKLLPGNIVSIFSGAGRILYDAGVRIINGFLDGLKDKFNDVKNFVGGIGKWISDHKGPVSYDKTLLVKHGNAIMEGFNTGLLQGFSDTMGIVGGMGVSIGTSVMSPSISLPGGSQGGTLASQGGTTRYGDTIVQIGEVNNQQDENFVLRRMDRDSQLQRMGMSPGGEH